MCLHHPNQQDQKVVSRYPNHFGAEEKLGLWDDYARDSKEVETSDGFVKLQQSYAHQRNVWYWKNIHMTKNDDEGLRPGARCIPPIIK